MRSAWIIVLTLCFVTVSVQAQGVVPATGAGAKAVLFSFSGLATLGAGNFDGGIGGRYFLTDAMSVRGGVRFASAGQDVPANAPAGQQGVDGSLSALVYGVSGAVEIRMARKRVSPYLGGGVSITMTSTESKSSEQGNPPPAQTVVKNDNGGEVVNGTFYSAGTTLSLFGLFGVEFFLYEEMSLAAEYRLGYASTSRPDEETTVGPTTTTVQSGGGSTLGFTNGGALTLAVYF